MTIDFHVFKTIQLILHCKGKDVGVGAGVRVEAHLNFCLIIYSHALFLLNVTS